MMEALFLRVLAVSAAVSLLLLPLLLLRPRLEKTYAPQTRWGLWLAIALVLLLAPWVPKPQAPLVVEAPAYQVSLPARPQKNPTTAPAAPIAAPPVGAIHESPVTPVSPEVPAAPEIPMTPVTPEEPISATPMTPTALQPTEPQPSAIPLITLTAYLWLAGLAAVLLWQGGRYLLLRRRLLRASTPVTGLEGYAAELGLAGKVTFRHCQAVPGPMTLGVWKPLVLLPPEGLAPAALRHELYHVKRRDVAYKILLLTACALHWFDPLVWALYRWADRDVEACCDAAVIADRDNAYKKAYGELLLSAAAGPRSLPFTTSFGGGANQMRARLTQLFRPGRHSRTLVCALLAAAVLLSGLVACQQATQKPLADGVYCSPYANVTWPIGEPDAEGEDYGSIQLSLLNYNEIEGPNGKPLGEYTLPLSSELEVLEPAGYGLKSLSTAGERGTEEWNRRMAGFLNWPILRSQAYPDRADYLVVTVKDGEITRLSWALVDREDAMDPDDAERLTPLTENTMPTLVYYDPDRDFLLYHTLDTVCFHYGDHHEEFQADQWQGRRVIWRCDVSEDERTVYLSDVFDDSENRGEHFYAWDIDKRTLTEVDSIPPGVDHATHVSGEELMNSGFNKTADLRSNALKTADGTVVALTIDSTLGDGTLPYLCFTWVEPGKYSQSRFLTPERIPAPRDYTDPDWGFTLHLPESLEGNYVVSKAANNWSFYAKDLYPAGGYLFSLWAEDFDTQQELMDSQDGLWSGKIPGEKNGVTYLLTTWDEEQITPTERENKTYMAMLRDSWGVTADDLDLTGVTRSGGYLWPLPYTEYGSDFLLGELDNTLRILSPAGLSVQSVAGGQVESVVTHPVTGERTLILRHPDGRYSEYGHLEYIQLEPGADVKRGDIIGFAREEDGRRWLSFRLLEGASLSTATPIDPWNAEYRTYDFLPVTRDSLTIAGDPAIEETLQAVLRGELDFRDAEGGAYRNVNRLGDSDGVPVSVYRYAQVDMDNDSIPEIVLWLDRGGDEYQLGSIILRYQGGTVYGYPMGFRSMNLLNLKRDGTYSWSGGAFYNGWGRKNFYGDGTVDTLRHDYDTYYVNGNPATQEAYDRAVEAQAAKPDVVWYRWGGGAYLTLHLADGRFLEVRLLTTEPDRSYFPVHRIEVYEGDTLLQTIDTATLPQPESYAWDGCFVNRGYRVGEPIVKDLNFDGSQDFGLLAVSGYPHNVPYNYFLWNQEKNCFEYAFTRFSELEPDSARRELVETEYSTTGDIQRRYTLTKAGTLEDHSGNGVL